ncbi:unnamed protein product [Enterobius vermicularis]|uniref:DNA-directed RNA polymerase III subunit n=1 Tax=Enterobius vermicularis TaxID=51028 RepID=A0A0N4V552_ENTVE|nr:unnamed protein product [Enterobius vermicularis]
MPRGGRGGGRGAATAGIRAVANALGIARSEVGAYTKIISEAPPLYPSVSQSTLPVERTDELQYMAELRQELLTRFHESSFYMEAVGRNCDVRRYTDKYRALDKEKLIPDWSRLPDELDYRHSTKVHDVLKKRRRIEDNGVLRVEEKLAKLEEHEDTVELDEDAQVEAEKEASSGSEDEEKEIDEQACLEPLSDDDYLEEDNDYIHSYFDNGENYGDVGSDDNLDDDNAF